MTVPPLETSIDLACDHCGYDLRAHRQDANCPECGTSVAYSRQSAAVPRRPAWRESDPRWRRRMLAGVWLLVFLPLMDVAWAFDWPSRLPAPNAFGLSSTLDETFFCSGDLYKSLVFCMGVVLLFSKEHGRRRDRLDWTRRWGIICSYIVLLLSAAEILFLPALVLVVITSLFLGLPMKYQPGATEFFGRVSTTYVRYGPYPKEISVAVHVAFSSIAVLFACLPLYNALRSSGPKRFAIALLSPLGLFVLIQLALAARYCIAQSAANLTTIYDYEVYFRPRLLVNDIARFLGRPNFWATEPAAFLMEAVKWCVVFAIAVWLSIAQVATWRQRR